MQAESSAQAGLTLPATMSYAQLSSLLASPDSPVLLLDVRTAEEYAAGHIPGAVLAPYDALAATFTEADKNRPIVLYCRSGNRSGIAMRTLRSMGYANLSDFGGIPNWKGGLEQ
ncbi:MAG TPA: rhodanese-like domain-containing protein [Spirochaetaceae bacterium]|nr:rhodanese-like domain-containing protein [Spirochaetaceae bacterium]